MVNEEKGEISFREYFKIAIYELRCLHGRNYSNFPFQYFVKYKIQMKRIKLF